MGLERLAMACAPLRRTIRRVYPGKGDRPHAFTSPSSRGLFGICGFKSTRQPDETPPLQLASSLLFSCDDQPLLEGKDWLERGPRVKVETRPSTIQGAGLGVFLAEGIVSKGDPLALYPGVWHPGAPSWGTDPIQLPTSRGGYVDAAEGHTRIEGGLDPDSPYSIFCLNSGGYLDGEPRILKGASDFAFAVGHLINHPQGGSPPNVVAVDFQWTWDLVELSQRQGCGLPNRVQESGLWFVDAIDGPIYFEEIDDSLKPRPVGVVFLAARNIYVGEELFFDYELSNKGRGWPDWYTPAGKL